MTQELFLSPSKKGSSTLSTWFIFVFLSPILCAFSGFHAASYLLTGLYTWPRTSRVLVLLAGMFIFSYEFIYRHEGPALFSGKKLSQNEWILYTCIIPYCLGAGTLGILAVLSS